MKTVALRKIGNSQGVILDKSILDLVEASGPNTVFKLKIKNGAIVLEPLSDADKQKIALNAAEKITKEQKGILDKLSK